MALISLHDIGKALGSAGEEGANLIANIGTLGTIGGAGERHLGGKGETVGTSSTPSPILQALGVHGEHITPPAPHPAAAAHPAATATTTAAGAPAQGQPQMTVQDLLSAILGGQQGQVPKGYADFFTQVLGPMMTQQAGAFDKQLEGVKGADPNVIANLMAINDATAKASGIGAQGLQQFVAGPLANYQKLVQQLQNALSFIPYSAQGIASMPVQAGSVLAQLGINPAATSLIGGAPTAGGAPPLAATNPGAVVTAGG